MKKVSKGIYTSESRFPRRVDDERIKKIFERPAQSIELLKDIIKALRIYVQDDEGCFTVDKAHEFLKRADELEIP